MPSNRWGEWQIYMEAYQAGLIDKTEALKKTDIFDKEGVLERTDIITKLQQQLESAEEQIKKLSGDLQTAHRESVGSRKKVEVEKFKTQLKQQQFESKAGSQIALGKLNQAVKLEEEKLHLRSQAQSDFEKSQQKEKKNEQRTNK